MKLNLRLIALLFAVLFASAAIAQKDKKSSKKDEEESMYMEDDDNMVPNGSFENVTDLKALKQQGQLKELCPPWYTPNSTPADVFSSGVKSTKVAVPKNDLGTQIPSNGQNYAGFRAFTKDPKKTRTYLQVKLKKRLTKGQLYCIRFDISLADLSKNGVNNIGMVISDRQLITNDDAALTLAPQIIDKTNKAITIMDGWETICGTYSADGDEEYIIIGAFGAEDKMKQEKVKKPASETGVVLNESYYYIDNVEIKEIEATSQCKCSKEEAKGPDLIYSKAGVVDENLTPKEKLEAASVYFGAFSADVPAMFEEEIGRMAALMKENASFKLELEGHTENEEAEEAKIKPHLRDLATRRAEAVKTALVAAGVDAARIAVVSKDNTVPANTRPTPLAKAQNRRVEFNVK